MLDIIDIGVARAEYKKRFEDIVKTWEIVPSDIIELHEAVFNRLEMTYSELLGAIQGVDIASMESCYNRFLDAFKEAQEKVSW